MATVVGSSFRCRSKFINLAQFGRHYSTTRPINRSIKQNAKYLCLIGGGLLAFSYAKWAQYHTVQAFNPKKIRVSPCDYFFLSIISWRKNNLNWYGKKREQVILIDIVYSLLFRVVTMMCVCVFVIHGVCVEKKGEKRNTSLVYSINTEHLRTCAAAHTVYVLHESIYMYSVCVPYYYHQRCASSSYIYESEML